MLHPSTKKLIDRLCEMTIQRKIDWVSGERPGVLAYDTEGYRVLLDGNPAALSLCDALGNELERATQADIAATQHIDGGTYETVLETMRADADRIARGTEGAIASVLGSLDLDAPTSLPEPAQTVLEDAPDGVVDEIGDQIEDTTDAIGTLSTDMPEAFEEIIDQADTPQMDAQFEAPQLDTEIDLPDEVDLPSIETVAETMREDMPSIETLAEGSEDIEKAVANLADEVNNAAQSDNISPPDDETLSGTATAALMGGAALVGGAMLGQSEDNTEAETVSDAPVDTPENAPAESTQQTTQAAGFISLSGLASGNNGFVTPVITDTPQAQEPVQSEPTAEAIEATPEPVEPTIAPETPETSPLSAETIEAPVAATPEDEIIAKLDEFIEPETPAEPAPPLETETPLETEATADPASQIAPDPVTQEPVSAEPAAPEPAPATDLSSDNLVEAPAAPPAPVDTQTEAASEEEKPEKAPNKRFNPWI